jgi:hypothetical protein
VRKYDAIYHEDTNPTWRGNPLIEALNPVLSDEQFALLVTNTPIFDESDRLRPAEERLAMLCHCEKLFLPFEHHVTLNQRLARVIRAGYEQRNPIDDRNQHLLKTRVEEFTANLKYGLAPYEPEAIHGFALTGISGVGKSSAISSILRFYPQVLIHREYEGKELNMKQLVWLKLQCPQDGSPKALCKDFFESVDAIFNTPYTKDYAKDHHTTSQMLPHVARVAGLVNLGVLIIDEIQMLSVFRSQGDPVMLNFFTRLTNTIRIPVILIGTPESKKILDGALHQMRRNSGQGEMKWSAMPQNDDWENFVETLWDYQYVQNFQPLTIEIKNTLHKVSRGVVGFATKIFIIAQERAINSGDEQLSEKIIETVAKEDFATAVDKLRQLYPDKKASTARQKQPESEPGIAPKKDKRQRSKTQKNMQVLSSGPDIQNELDSPRMISVSKEARNLKTPVYETLKANGFVKSGREFLV